MTPENSVALLDRALREAGVDADHPDPAAAWTVYKWFANVPVECARDNLFFQAGDGNPPDGPGGYFGFVREFEMRGASGDEPVWFEQVHVEFQVPPPLRLDVGEVNRFSTDFPTYEEFFAAVESMPEFQSGLKFVGFGLSVYHTGV